MFIKYKYVRSIYSGFVTNNSTNSHFYILHDTDFDQEFVINSCPSEISIELEIRRLIAIAKIYENKKYNAAANISTYLTKKDNSYNSAYNHGFDRFVELSSKYLPDIACPFFDKYSADIKKYMLLL